MEGGGNVVIRLRPNQLAIDVDPKRFPPDQPELDRHFFEVYGIDPDLCPKTWTPNGGYHLLLSKQPADRLFASIDRFPGIDLLSEGRLLVAPGSTAEVIDRDPHDPAVRHPTGEFVSYRADGPSPAEGLPSAPARLLEAVRRPESRLRQPDDDDPEYTPGEAADLLHQLDPADFRDYEEWRRLGMAIYAATRGEARSEWIDWCTSDIPYSSDQYRIGRHWDSWDRATYDKGDPISFRTLHFLALRNATDPARSRIPSVPVSLRKSSRMRSWMMPCSKPTPSRRGSWR